MMWRIGFWQADSVRVCYGWAERSESASESEQLVVENYLMEVDREK